MNAVWKQSRSTGRARLVLLAIADHQGEIGAWPSIPTLARMVNASERSVQRDIQELVELGELEVHSQQAPSRGQYKANLYWVRLPGVGQTVEPGVTDVEPGVTETGSSGVTNSASGVTKNASGVTTGGVLTLIEPLQNQIHVQAPLEPAFEKFWDVYPRKQGKGKAREAFAKAFQVHGYVVTEGARRYAADPNLPAVQFIPLPATWLNQERWNDAALPERELTKEEIAERNLAESRTKMDASREATRRMLEEQAEEARKAAADPPRLCEHERIAWLCKPCAPKYLKDLNL